MADPKKLRADANALAVELLQRLGSDEVQELEVRRGPLRVRVSKAVVAPTAAPGSSIGSQVAAGPMPVTPEAPAADRVTVNAPLTGIFYRSPSPQTPPFVQVGSVIAQGDVIGLIEAMKLFNEIRSTSGGTVRRILVENGQLVRAHAPILELE